MYIYIYILYIMYIYIIYIVIYLFTYLFSYFYLLFMFIHTNDIQSTLWPLCHPTSWPRHRTVAQVVLMISAGVHVAITDPSHPDVSFACVCLYCQFDAYRCTVRFIIYTCMQFESSWPSWCVKILRNHGWWFLQSRQGWIGHNGKWSRPCARFHGRMVSCDWSACAGWDKLFAGISHHVRRLCITHWLLLPE